MQGEESSSQRGVFIVALICHECKSIPPVPFSISIQDRRATILPYAPRYLLLISHHISVAEPKSSASGYPPQRLSVGSCQYHAAPEPSAAHPDHQ